MDKTISVWLKLENGKNKDFFALQRRSARSAGFPLIYQATWAGKVEDNENLDEAVKRECKEELGEDFYNDFNFLSLSLFSEGKFELKGKKWTCYNYIGGVDEETLKKAKIHEDAEPEFYFVNKENYKEIKLFEDQFKVLNNIFNGN